MVVAFPLLLLHIPFSHLLLIQSPRNNKCCWILNYHTSKNAKHHHLSLSKLLQVVQHPKVIEVAHHLLSGEAFWWRRHKQKWQPFIFKSIEGYREVNEYDSQMNEIEVNRNNFDEGIYLADDMSSIASDKSLFGDTSSYSDAEGIFTQQMIMTIYAK